MIDRGELGHVCVGQRRVRVRQSQVDAFLAAGESSQRPAQANPWQPVSEAASAVVAAVSAQGRAVLDRALSRLTDTLREIPGQDESRNVEPGPAN
jgi:hypothetical protein